MMVLNNLVVKFVIRFVILLCRQIDEAMAAVSVSAEEKWKRRQKGSMKSRERRRCGGELHWRGFTPKRKSMLKCGVQCTSSNQLASYVPFLSFLLLFIVDYTLLALSKL